MAESLHENVKIETLFPEFAGVKEGSTAPLTWVSKPSEGEDNKPYTHNFKCTWNKITTKKKKLLGYYVQLTLAEVSESYPLAVNKFPPSFEFGYDPDLNVFTASAGNAGFDGLNVSSSRRESI